MDYTLLGKSELLISKISFGTMSLKPQQQNIQQLLFAAIDEGINFFDTADLYDKGQNEIAVGKALKEKRSQVILATKVGNEWLADGSGWQWNPTKKYILSAVEQSLRRLDTDYIDLYQLHGGTIADDMDDTIDAFELLQKAGKIRYYGISSIRPNVIREYLRRSNIVSVMMQYSLLDRRPEEQCLQLLANHQVGVLARGVLAGGLLVNKPPVDYLMHPAATVSKARNAAAEGESSTAVAVKFVLDHPAISSAVIGVRTPEQLTDLCNCLQQFNLSAKEMQNLREAAPALVYKEHR
jgi:aryl-alcohol dehydrogenase-like predicted oxidoreductase